MAAHIRSSRRETGIGALLSFLGAPHSSCRSRSPTSLVETAVTRIVDVVEVPSKFVHRPLERRLAVIVREVGQPSLDEGLLTDLIREYLDPLVVRDVSYRFHSPEDATTATPRSCRSWSVGRGRGGSAMGSAPPAFRRILSLLFVAQELSFRSGTCSPRLQ
jgi:hypothetical protein